jgi:hypothetical protein
VPALLKPGRGGTPRQAAISAKQQTIFSAIFTVADESENEAAEYVSAVRVRQPGGDVLANSFQYLPLFFHY